MAHNLANRKEERQKKKEEEEAAIQAAKEKSSSGSTASSQKTAANDSGISLLSDLPEDALKQVLCCLPAADLGRVSMTCSQMNQALVDVREAFVLSRLRHSRVEGGGCVEMCEGVEEAR